MIFKILSRLSIALAAFLFTYIANLLFSDMSLQAANDYVSNPLHWMIFTFYLIGISFLIDWIFKKINGIDLVLCFSLYISWNHHLGCIICYCVV